MVKVLTDRVHELETQLAAKDIEIKNLEGNNEALHAALENNQIDNDRRSMELREVEASLAEARADLARSTGALSMSSRLAFILTTPITHASNPGRIRERVDDVIERLEALRIEAESEAVTNA